MAGNSPENAICKFSRARIAYFAESAESALIAASPGKHGDKPGVPPSGDGLDHESTL
ncbi:MAG: hypothetical protein ACI9R3_006034 [Verrucomicrobiales bacterium]|jgi:hypothetical protein